MTDCKFANYTGSATTTPESDTSIKTVVMTPVIPNVNLHKVIAALDKNAHEKSQGKCAHYVGLSLKAGGGTLNGNQNPNEKNRPEYAKNWGCLLKRNGFKELTTKVDDNYAPAKGDAVIIQGYEAYTDKHGKHHSKDMPGHIAIYDGTQWISDFKQRIFPLSGLTEEKKFTAIENSFYPGGGYREANPRPAYVIYRKMGWE